MKRETVKFEDREKETDRHALIHPWAQVLTPLVRVVALFETLKGAQGSTSVPSQSRSHLLCTT